MRNKLILLTVLILISSQSIATTWREECLKFARKAEKIMIQRQSGNPLIKMIEDSKPNSVEESWIIQVYGLPKFITERNK